MPGLAIRAVTDGGTPPYRYYQVGLNKKIFAGDVVVLSDHANDSASGEGPALRCLHPSDIATYQNAAGTVTLGVLGVALESVISDANGNAIGVPATVETIGPKVVFPVPGVPGSIPTADTGSARVLVAVFDDKLIVGGLLAGSTVVTDALIGVRVGLSVTPASGTAVQPLTYKWDPAATTTIGVITGVNKTHPLYGKAGGEVYVRVDRTFQQALISADYYDQSRSFEA